MNKLVPYKFEVVAVCHIVDDDGNIVAEQPLGGPSQNGLVPVTVFAVAGLVNWAQGFQKQIDQINAQQVAPSPSPEDA
jgi:hypothetical protein